MLELCKLTRQLQNLDIRSIKITFVYLNVFRTCK